MALAAVPAEACTVCYGETESTWLDGARISVLMLLAVVFALQVAFATFFIKVRNKSKAQMPDVDDFAPVDGPEAA